VKYFQMTDMEYERSGSVHPKNTAANKLIYICCTAVSKENCS